MPDMVAPIDTDGRYLSGPLVPIDAVHRQAMPHRGVWLHVLASDDALLLVRRSPSMVTCAGTLSIVGEHHSGRESDDECAARALREELPGLVSAFGVKQLDMVPLRPRPRWFLFDYGPPRPRADRCLISEYVVRLPSNTSAALAAIRAGREREEEHEASELFFEPLPRLWRRLRDEPQAFCAPELLPRCLQDTVADLLQLRAPPNAGERALHGINRSVRAWRNREVHGYQVRSVAAPVMPERYDISRVVRSAGLARPSGAAV